MDFRTPLPLARKFAENVRGPGKGAKSCNKTDHLFTRPKLVLHEGEDGPNHEYKSFDKITTQSVRLSFSKVAS